MRVRLFNRGKGWYISCSNYKDENDKAYLGVYFPQTVIEPHFNDNGRGYSVKDIDIEEAKFTSYKGKVGLTIFKYLELSDIQLEKTNARDEKGHYEEPKAEQMPLENKGKDMFGAISPIEPDDLPFY